MKEKTIHVIDIYKPFKILTIVIESKSTSRLSEQQSKRRDGLLNELKNASEHHLYLYLTRSQVTERGRERKTSYCFICSLMATTDARILIPK